MDRLQSQCNQMKYHINENIKAVILEEVEMARPAALYSMVHVPADEEQSELPVIFWNAASDCRGCVDIASQQCVTKEGSK